MNKLVSGLEGSIRQFGRAARRHWSLCDAGVFLNHGSFGACPILVQNERGRIQREFSAQPEEFFRRRVMPDSGESSVRHAASEIARFVGALETNVALVENATAGIQTVLESVQFEAGDQVLITDHQYRAVRLAVEKRCRESGATPVIVPIPIPADKADIVGRISEAATRKVKLAIVDHITSPTALVLPIAEIIAHLHRQDIPVLVDGAHAVGQVFLDLEALGAEWYVSNAHKWLFAPPGCAFLHARSDQARNTRCLITSHFGDLGFPRAFDYVGTRDYVNWCTLPAAISFFRQLDPEGFGAHKMELIRSASVRLMALGAEPVSEMNMCQDMRTFVLPQLRAAEPNDAVIFRDSLWRDEKIQIAASTLLDRLLLRISAQAYVDASDIERFVDVLERRGWPGRK